jgi:hypothetical protein
MASAVRIPHAAACMQQFLYIRHLGRVSLHFASPGLFDASARRYRLADIRLPRNRRTTPGSAAPTSLTGCFEPDLLLADPLLRGQPTSSGYLIFPHNSPQRCARPRKLSPKSLAFSTFCRLESSVR